MKMRFLAILLVLCCTLSLLGCENQLALKEKETKPATETEETVADEKETQGEDIVPGVPGSPELTAVEIFDLTYGQIKGLEWDELDTAEQDNGTWLCTAAKNNVEFTFVFPNPYQSDDVIPEVLTVDGDGVACITADNNLGDTLDVFSEEIQEQAEHFDGGLYVNCILEGKNAQMQFDEDTTKLVVVQLRCDAK